MDKWNESILLDFYQFWMYYEKSLRWNQFQIKTLSLDLNRVDLNLDINLKILIANSVKDCFLSKLTLLLPINEYQTYVTHKCASLDITQYFNFYFCKLSETS